MTAKTILKEIEPLGSESYKKILFKHGVQEPCFGVKIAALKTIQRRIRKDYQLSLELYDTGVFDAMYLAGLIADDAKMTTQDLRRWVANATHIPLASSTVAWVTAGSPHGWDMAREWIDSGEELAACAGWATLRSLVSITDDTKLDCAALRALLERVRDTIHKAPPSVRREMNWFLIAVGSYVKSLTVFATEMGETIGPVAMHVGDTACQIPFAPDYIRKVEKRGSIGKKRKTAKC
jgi:3-methyladenine DNA glycosylase AlkD